MKILIIGGSGEGSIGFAIKPLLSTNVVDCVSRHYSTVDGKYCDVQNPNEVEVIIKEVKPDVIIFAVGKYLLTNFENNFSWPIISELVSSRILGGMIVSETALRHEVKKIIFLGGTMIGTDSRMIHYKPLNAALWNLVQCLTIHTMIDAFYLELGLVYPSKIGVDYVADLLPEDKIKCLNTAVSPKDIVRAIEQILFGEIPRGSKLIVNRGLI